MLESHSAKLSLLALRVALGWMMFYAGITKVLNPSWSAEGYLKSAKTFPELYAFFASQQILPIVNFINEWGLTLLGVSLILGLCIRLSAPLGAVLMLLYYLPILTFPTVKTTAFIVDEHMIYIFVLLFFFAIKAGRIYGCDRWRVGVWKLFG